MVGFQSIGYYCRFKFFNPDECRMWWGVSCHESCESRLWWKILKLKSYVSVAEALSKKKHTHAQYMEQTHEFCCSSPSKYAFTHVMLEEFLIFPSIFQNLKNKTPWKTIAHSSFLCWKSFLGSDPNCLCAWAAPRAHPQPSGRWTENRFVERRPGEAKPRSRGGAPGWHNSNSQGWWFYHVISMLNGAYKPA